MAIIHKDINLLTQKQAVAGTEKLPVSATEYITPNQITQELDEASRTDTVFTSPWEVGYVIYSNGTISGSSAYNHAEFTVEEGTVIKLRTDASSATAIIAAYNSSGVYQQDKSVPGTGTVRNYEYVVPSGITMIRVSVYNNDSYKRVELKGPLYSALKKYVDDNLATKQKTITVSSSSPTSSDGSDGDIWIVI